MDESILGSTGHTLHFMVREIVRGTPQEEEYVNANNYHAPYVFWGLALRDGLITKGEWEALRICYGRLWNYVGD